MMMIVKIMVMTMMMNDCHDDCGDNDHYNGDII